MRRRLGRSVGAAAPRASTASLPRSEGLSRSRDRRAPCGHGRRGWHCERVATRGSRFRSGSPPRGRSRAAPGHPLASSRDHQRSRGHRPPRRAARPARSGDPRRGGERRPRSRAHLPLPASGWKEALSRPARLAPHGAFPGSPTTPARWRDSRRTHRSTASGGLREIPWCLPRPRAHLRPWVTVETPRCRDKRVGLRRSLARARGGCSFPGFASIGM